MRIHRDERGQTIILVALSLPLLLGFVGIATDVGALFKDKRTLQTAADAAAVAGALNLNYGSAAITAAADKAAAANGYTNGSNGVTTTVPATPQWQYSNYKGVAGYVEVTITKPESTIFLSIFGHPSVPVTARAVATTGGPGAGCVYTLGQTGIGFDVNGNVDLSAPKCGINVDSDATNAFRVNGNVTVDVSSIGIVGGFSKNGNVSMTPTTPSTGIVPYSDPLSFLPAVSCTGTTSCTVGGSTMSCGNGISQNGNTPVNATQGCYNGFSANGNANVNLAPGTYIINGPFTLNGNGAINGTGVTLIIASGGITINGNTTLNLTAPTSGTFSGILFYQSSTDASTATMNGNSNNSIQGIFYFPDAKITMNGNSSTQMYTDFVAKSIDLTGNLTFNDYAALSGVTSPLSSVVLVE
jgi:Flp pilus assembly protein TadG